MTRRCIWRRAAIPGPAGVFNIECVDHQTRRSMVVTKDTPLTTERKTQLYANCTEGEGVDPEPNEGADESE